MNREEIKLNDDAVATWENEGGKTLSSSKADRKAGIWLVSSIFPSIVSSIPSDCQRPKSGRAPLSPSRVCLDSGPNGAQCST